MDSGEMDTIESLCMNCMENGTTRLLIHKIPFFRELILASFKCEHCGNQNNEVTFGGEIQPKGCIYELKVQSSSDLNRQIIKSDSATIKIPEIAFEIPPMTQKGEISTIEGFLKNAAKNLSLFQRERYEQQPEVAEKVAVIISKLIDMANGDDLAFTVLVDDPAGNSFVENPQAPIQDPSLKIYYYPRTAAQDISLGLQPESTNYNDDSNFTSLIDGKFGGQDSSVTVTEGTETTDTSDPFKLGKSEVVSIQDICPSCSQPGESLTALTSIPHFKEVIIMAFTCSICGFRNSEIKGGGAVPTYGTEVTLMVTSVEDLKRDVLKSDTAMVIIPELELELQHGSLGGVYTTVEGLLIKIYRSLEENNPFAYGDSTKLHHSLSPEISETSQRFTTFLTKLKGAAEGQIIPLAVILRDPLGNSFVSPRLGTFTPPELDTNLKILDFERSFEENEEFGLNDINTKDFETGFENENAEATVVLSDRLTHITKKGIDHPTVFAKGTPDITPGGIFWGSTNTIDSTPSLPSSGDSNHVEVEEVEEGYTDVAPGILKGWVALKEGETFQNIPDAPPSTSSLSSRTKIPPLPHDACPVILEGKEEEEEEDLNNESENRAGEQILATEVPTITAGGIKYVGNPNKRIFYDDSNLKFIPKEEWSGAKEGMVFRLGSLGLGYYEDVDASLRKILT